MGQINCDRHQVPEIDSPLFRITIARSSPAYLTGSRIKQGLLICLAMEVLKLTTAIDELGYLHLNIPRRLAAVEVNVVVVLNPVSLDGKQKASYQFSDLAGRLTWQGDAVAIQRNLRDEW